MTKSRGLYAMWGTRVIALLAIAGSSLIGSTLNAQASTDAVRRDTPKTIGAGTGKPQLVRAAQVMLSHTAFPVKISGNFNDATQEAVLGFQRANGLTVNGLVDGATWKALEVSESKTLVQNPRQINAPVMTGGPAVDGTTIYISLDEGPQAEGCEFQAVDYSEWGQPGVVYKTFRDRSVVLKNLTVGEHLVRINQSCTPPPGNPVGSLPKGVSASAFVVFDTFARS